jgi:hypothetical protein
VGIEKFTGLRRGKAIREQAVETYNRTMSVYEDRREELERFEFMMGPTRGRLAVTMDLLTDALVLVGQHGVYCQSNRIPGRPAMDVEMVLKSLNDAKELISSVMEELKKSKEARDADG